MSRWQMERFPTPPGLDLPQPRALMSLLSAIGPIAAPWSKFARALMNEGVMAPALREVAILRVAWRGRCAYEWDAHLVLARHCGVDNAALALVKCDGTGPEAQPVERLLVSAVDELLDEGMIPVATRLALEGALGHAAIVELTMLVGQYTLLNMVCKTFGLSSEGGRSTAGRQLTEAFP
jgi:4-carboxymuconolactone decarboxylase